MRVRLVGWSRGCDDVGGWVGGAQVSYVFGPVPSRRLGRSLGVDTVPSKVCNWNCVYCQLGRSMPIVHERSEYLPTAQVLDELDAALKRIGEDQIDWITFVASGEGTLHVDIGHLIAQAKRMTAKPVAVITNGSLLHLAEVREGLAAADAVMPSLDAAEADLFQRINRPHPSLTFDLHVQGLRQFARMPRHAKLWVQVMLVAGLNDTDQALADLRRLLDEMQPDEIHLTLPTRCPAESWVRPPDHDRLLVVQSVLGPRAQLASAHGIELELRKTDSLQEQIRDIVVRHPMRLAELEAAGRRASLGDLADVIESMRAQGLIELIDHSGETFVRCR